MTAVLKRGDKSERVIQLQRALQRAGHLLPRFGADGDLGFETLDAAELFADDDTKDNTPNDTIPLELEVRILKVAKAEMVMPSPTAVVSGELAPGFIDARHLYAGTVYSTRNPWTVIDTICLHQMAVDAKAGWERWRRLAIHVVVPRSGVSALTNDINRKVPHGHGWNSRSVGFEVEGHFAGIHGKNSTHWTPSGAKGSRLTPQEPTASQVSGALAAIAWCVAEVKKNGGEIKYVGAHRQSYGAKTSDPGSLIWQQIALPAMAAHGLTTGPTLKHHKYPGKPIPAEWDPAQVGVKY